MTVFRWPLLAATAFLLAIPAIAQDIACQQGQSNKPATRTLDNGFVITIRPAGSDAPELGCEAELRDRSNKAIFSDRGFSTRIHPATGRDIDNDGRPDAVIGVDTGGGNRCCWEYAIVSLGPSPRVLVRLPSPVFDFDTTKGKTLIWSTAAFYDLGPSMADSPAVKTVHEFRPNGFVDVTPEYCERMLAGELRGPGDMKDHVSALTLAAKQGSRMETAGSYDREQTRVAATTVALQQIYCGRFADASWLVREVWPNSEQTRIRSQIKDAINGRWPDLAKRMGVWN